MGKGGKKQEIGGRSTGAHFNIKNKLDVFLPFRLFRAILVTSQGISQVVCYGWSDAVVDQLVTELQCR